METRASQYAARVVEAGWLAAVIVVPVFFNVWSNRVFEPDKLTLLRSIALVMAVGLLAWAVERGRREGDGPRRWLRVPLVAPVVALTFAYALSSLLSVVPQLSILGSYQRMQGLYTWLAYMTLFASIVLLLRRRDQLDRLLLAVIVTSLPVALYGVIQNRGLDPMPWLGDVTFRVASTMGNSIFVAAFVVLAVPLTVVKVVEAMRAIEPDDADGAAARHPSAAVMRAAAYLVLLFVQLVCVVLAQSRGPWLGLLGAMFLMLLIAAAFRPTLASRRLWATVVFVGLGIVPALGLLAFNVAPEGTALDRLRDARYVGRLGRVLETEGGTGKVRVLIWDGAIDLATSDPLRFVVGYGPESMHVAYNPHYPPELAHYESRNASPDRSHNETLDALVTTGLVGLLAYLALFTALFAHALRWLGLIADDRDRNLFLLLWGGGGLLAVIVFRIWSGDWTFFGVALPAGMMAGLVSFAYLRALFGRTIPDRPARLLVLGLTAALAAHFIEINFGIAIAATRTLFFTLTAALVVVGGLHAERPELLHGAVTASAPEPHVRRQRRARRAQREGAPAPGGGAWTASAFVMLVLLVTMVFDFFVRAGFGLDSGGRLQELMVLGWLFSLTWAVGTLVLGSEAILAPGGSRSGIGAYLAITLGGLVVYLLLHSLVLGGAAQAGGADTSSALLVLYAAALLVLVLTWAWILARRDPPGGALSRVGALWVYPLIGLAALALGFFTNINEVRADIYYKEGWAGYHARANDFLARGDPASAEAYFDSALISYDRALALDPREDYYLLFKGKALLEEADGAAQQVDGAIPPAALVEGFSEYDDPDLRPRVTQRDDAFARAIAVLEQARDLAPLNTDHFANLGRAYQVWGERTYDPGRRAERLAESLIWFEEAIALSPKNAGLRTEMATSAFLSGDDDGAMALIEEAIGLDDQFGRPFRLRATIHRESQRWADAETDYRSYVSSRDGKGDAVGWSGLAFVLGQLGKADEAIEANEAVLALAGDDLPTLRNLVLLHRDAGNREAACAYVVRGLGTAPQDAGLLQLADEIGCQVDGGPEPEAVPVAPDAAGDDAEGGEGLP